MEDDNLIKKGAVESDTVLKIMCAIMNEEESVDAYEDKTPEDIVDILKSINVRFPNNEKASYDPAYIRFAQACLNGYNTFGIDFFKQLTKRLDSTQSLCFKGLIDVYNNSLIDNIMIILENYELKIKLAKLENRLEDVDKLTKEFENIKKEFMINDNKED